MKKGRLLGSDVGTLHSTFSRLTAGVDMIAIAVDINVKPLVTVYTDKLAVVQVLN
jgi:hypothetical protein